MERVTVESDLVSSIAYDPEEHILEVEFRNRSVYRYFLVPASIYEELIAAPSIGKYIRGHFTSGRYPFEEIR